MDPVNSCGMGYMGRIRMKFEYKISLLYFTIGALWILLSDRLVVVLFQDMKVIAILNSIKGMFYVIITTLLLYHFVHRHLKRLAKVEDDLIKAKERAEESDRLKTTFIQNLSHEIRTPMNAIVGFSELMAGNPDNKEKVKRFTAIIQQRSGDLLDIIDSLLDIAKIEAGQLSVNPEKFSLAEFLREIEDNFREQQVRKNKGHIQLSSRIPEGTGFIITDRVKLKQVFTNLLSNAFKFTENGFVEFGLKENRGQLVFFVFDTGTGISEKDQGKIFERFYQGNTGNGPYKEGNGIGLSIVKGLVNLLGGEIWVESVAGRGSTFYFSVLQYQKGEETNAEPDKKLAEVSVMPANSPGKSVLVVEDDQFNSSLIKEILGNQSLDLWFVSTGKEAVYAVQHSDFDLVLMDIGLPDMSGYEAIRQILEHAPDLKIIAQTAYATGADQNMALKTGCVDYISKPIKVEQLVNTIHKYI